MRIYEKIAPARFSRIVAIAIFALASVVVFGAETELSERAQQLREHVQYLASEELEGRESGQQGNQKAAEYIANYFKTHNVRPVGGSYFQTFDVVTKLEAGPNNAIDFDMLVLRPGLPREKGRISKRSWALEKDYRPTSFSDDASISGGLVFAGFGISAENLEYDDYAGIDVTDKVVIVVRGAPDQKVDPNIPFEKQSDPHSKFARYTSLRYKTTTAREKGAAGIIFVTPQGDSANVLMPLKAERGGRNSGIAAVHAKRTSVEKLMPRKLSLFKLETKIRNTLKPQSIVLDLVTIRMAVDVEETTSPTSNVIGYVPGSDEALANQYLVIGAHYDHLGWGHHGSLHTGAPAIHYGADDNASGTAALLEIAADIAQNPLQRPVMFMAFSGEEIGLLGSAHYCKNPLKPLDQTIFMLNLDMVGRFTDNKLNVMGSETSSRWNAMIDSVGEVYSIEFSKTGDGFGPSDHSSFYAKDIPVLFLFTGLHSDYHRPTDTWDKVNYSGLDTVVAVSESFLRTIAANPTKPDFVKTKSTARRSPSFSVYVGTIPDYSDNPKGLRITGVREGGPAQKGGLRGGDIIVKFGPKTIKNIYDYTYALSEFKPGDKVKVDVLRGEFEDEKKTLEITLEARK